MALCVMQPHNALLAFAEEKGFASRPDNDNLDVIQASEDHGFEFTAPCAGRSAFESVSEPGQAFVALTV